MKKDLSTPFDNLTFSDFRKRAMDETLSSYEKIGFPDAYREGKGEVIFSDILNKLPGLTETGKTVLDIGPGCSELSALLINHCRENNHTLLLMDSPEMLQHLPDEPFIVKIPGAFPVDADLLKVYVQKTDVILCYSVFQYIFAEFSVWAFLDEAMSLLAEGGAFLIGDIPNFSKRKRFFKSSRGVACHQAYTASNEIPNVDFNRIESGQIDDAVIFALLGRARLAGFDAYVLPQSPELPIASRREDVLILRP